MSASNATRVYLRAHVSWLPPRQKVNPLLDTNDEGRIAFAKADPIIPSWYAEGPGSDLMLFPTMHVTAPLFVKDAPPDPNGARAQSPLFDAGLLNVLGLPTLSLPCGFDQAGLPIGLCIVGPRYGEGQLLALASAFEQVTPWHRRVPPRL